MDFERAVSLMSTPADIRMISHAGTTLIIMAALWRVQRHVLQEDQRNQCWFMRAFERGGTPSNPQGHWPEQE